MHFRSLVAENRKVVGDNVTRSYAEFGSRSNRNDESKPEIVHGDIKRRFESDFIMKFGA